jgi:hypothetical protein
VSDTKKRKAEELVARGEGRDRILTSDEIDHKAIEIENVVRGLLKENYKFYVLVSGTYRSASEAWTCCTTRGNTKALINLANGQGVTGGVLQKYYGWKASINVYVTTLASNCNAVEKRVHQRMHNDAGAIWLADGAGGVYEDPDGSLKEFAVSFIYGPSVGLKFRRDTERSVPSVQPQSLSSSTSGFFSVFDRSQPQKTKTEGQGEKG